MSKATWLGLLTVAVIGALLVAGCPSSRAPEPGAPTPSALPETETGTAGPDVAQPTAPENIGNAKNAEGDYVCPVMGEVIEDFDEGNSVEHEGKVYFLCCSTCVVQFKADPGKYAAKAQASATEETDHLAAEDADHDEHAGHDRDSH